MKLITPAQDFQIIHYAEKSYFCATLSCAEPKPGAYPGFDVCVHGDDAPEYLIEAERITRSDAGVLVTDTGAVIARYTRADVLAAAKNGATWPFKMGLVSRN